MMPETAAVERAKPAATVEETTVSEPVKNGAKKPVFLSRDELLKKRPPRTKDVEVADWGTARVRALVQREADDLAVRGKRADGTRDNRGTQAFAIAMALVNQDGSPMFENAEEGAVLIGELPIMVVQALFTPVAELSLLTVEAEAEAGKGSAPTGGVKLS